MSHFHFRRSSADSSVSSRRASDASTTPAAPSAPATTLGPSVVSTPATTPGPSAAPSPSASAVSISVAQPAFPDAEVSVPRGGRIGDAFRRAKRWVEDDDVDGLSFDPVKSLQPSKLSWHTI